MDSLLANLADADLSAEAIELRRPLVRGYASSNESSDQEQEQEQEKRDVVKKRGKAVDYVYQEAFETFEAALKAIEEKYAGTKWRKLNRRGNVQWFLCCKCDMRCKVTVSDDESMHKITVQRRFLQWRRPARARGQRDEEL